MQYAYDPAIVRVNRGDRIRIRVVAFEVTHGFFLKGYDLDVLGMPMGPTLLVRHPSTGGRPWCDCGPMISAVAVSSGSFGPGYAAESTSTWPG